MQLAYLRAVLDGVAAWFVGGLLFYFILSLFGVPDTIATAAGSGFGIVLGIVVLVQKWRDAHERAAIQQALAEEEERKLTDWDYRKQRRLDP